MIRDTDIPVRLYTRKQAGAKIIIGQRHAKSDPRTCAKSV